MTLPKYTKLALLVVAQLALTLAALELVAVVAYPLLSDDAYSRERIQTELRNRQIHPPQKTLEGEPEEAFVAEHVLHPYTGFVFNADKDSRVNALGFQGKSPLLKRHPDQVNVAVLGGSVARELVNDAGSVLIAGLGRLPRYRGKRIELVCIAVDGFKQPQQLFALTYMLYLESEYDLVINVDGFNEIVLPLSDNLINRVPPQYPRSWNIYAQKGLGVADTLRLAKYISIQRDRESLDRIFSTSLLAKSNFGLVLWEILSRRAENATQEQYRKIVDLRNRDRQEAAIAPLPLYDGVDRTQDFVDNAKRWKMGSQLIQKLARTNNFRYFHFLQPNQYVKDSKVFTDEEKQRAVLDAHEAAPGYHHSARVYAWASETGYPHLSRFGRKLKSNGVDFTDLSMMFSDTSEAVYSDACCHFNKRGYVMIAMAIIDRIAAAP
jgi:hypothetical protein